MKVDTPLRTQALLQILMRKFRSSPAPVALAILEHEWRLTGLRADDLHDAVAALVAKGWVVELEFSQGRHLQVSGEALESIAAAAAGTQSLKDHLATTQVLGRLSRRARSGAPGSGRRSTDR